jgi:hypothetical protein
MKGEVLLLFRRQYSLSALSLRRYRDFSRSLLRRLILTAGDLGFFIMLSLCSRYAVVGGEAPRWSIERSSRRRGAEPPRRRGAEPPPLFFIHNVYNNTISYVRCFR